MINIDSISIYHIVHIDRLEFILNDGFLFCDKIISQTSDKETNIGMNKIKHRRLTEISLTNFPSLYVGDFVPFYFCPRSVMLYVIHRAQSTELNYFQGQDNIIHLVSNFKSTIEHANQISQKWAFTDGNAGSYMFNDYANISDIHKLDWNSINTNSWQQCRDAKQSEFLYEQKYPFELFHTIGVKSIEMERNVKSILQQKYLNTKVSIRPDWYY